MASKSCVIPVPPLGGTRTSSFDRSHVDYAGKRLYSTQGAGQVITHIKTCPSVSTLLLPYNELGDAGCVALFQFLGSTSGRKHHIATISLNSNKIGNRGLSAVVGYLENNQSLKTLSLQNNKFTSDLPMVKSFVDAINSSCLETLCLASNYGLADPFVQTFLPSLKSLSFQELNISAIHISPQSLSYIVDYLSCPHRCRLQNFGCSANMIGTPGMRTIVEAVERHNYRLRRLDIFPNPGEKEDVGSAESRDEWRATCALLTRVLIRNARLKDETERQAFRLLRYARILLLHSTRLSCHSSSSSCLSQHLLLPMPSDPPCLFIIPEEIKQHILSFFAPILNTAQRSRIYHYASSPATLPQLLPRLPVSNYRSRLVEDPVSMRRSYTKNFRDISSGPVHATIDYSFKQDAGLYNGAISPRRYDRVRWLASMGCDSYQPEGESSF